jgi:hypothetical protein
LRFSFREFTLLLEVWQVAGATVRFSGRLDERGWINLTEQAGAGRPAQKVALFLRKSDPSGG